VASLNSAKGLIALLAAVAVLPARARAEGDPVAASDPVEPARSARVEVVVGMTGPLSGEVRGELRRLLEVELRAQGLVLVERDPDAALSAWAEQASQDERTLLAVLLDARERKGWRVVVIDAARARAIARQLSGGIEENAASIEAVVSIVLSASSALREGLEVASSLVDDVVGGEPAAPSPPPKAPRPAEPRAIPAPIDPGETVVRVALGSSIATFSSAAPATWGASAALGLTFRSSVEFTASAAYYLPVTVDSAFGNFELDRATAALSGGPMLLEGRFGLTPEAGVCLEWLRRSATHAEAGVSATAEQSVQRWGALLALRSRYRVIAPLSVELRAGAAYFAQSVEFVAKSPENVRLADIAPAVFFGSLGLEAAFP